MSNTIDSERIAKDIIFLESDSSRGSWDVEEWEAKILSRYPVLQERVATAAGWIQMLIAEAVAAEREACARVAERVGVALKEAGIRSDYCWLIATNIRNMHQECKAADELEAFIAANTIRTGAGEGSDEAL